MAGFISFQAAENPALTFCIGHHILLVVAQGRNRSFPAKNGHLPFHVRNMAYAVKLLDIGHRAPDHFLGKLQLKNIPGFQQNRLRFLQALAHGTPGRFPEVPAFGMLIMCPA